MSSRSLRRRAAALVLNTQFLDHLTCERLQLGAQFSWNVRSVLASLFEDGPCFTWLFQVHLQTGIGHRPFHAIDRYGDLALRGLAVVTFSRSLLNGRVNPGLQRSRFSLPRQDRYGFRERLAGILQIASLLRPLGASQSLAIFRSLLADITTLFKRLRISGLSGSC